MSELLYRHSDGDTELTVRRVLHQDRGERQCHVTLTGKDQTSTTIVFGDSLRQHREVVSLCQALLSGADLSDVRLVEEKSADVHLTVNANKGK